MASETRPQQDTLVPELQVSYTMLSIPPPSEHYHLQDAWDECRRTFGPQNVLIVSNSAGSHLDAGEIQVCHPAIDHWPRVPNTVL